MSPLSACALLLASVSAFAQVPKNVLILTSEATEMPGLTVVVDQTVSAMRAAHGGVNVYLESFETSRFPRDTESLVTLYRQRYATRRLDLVVTICAPALDFALQHRDEIFPGAPILFSFLDRTMIPALPAAANVSGVLLDPDWAALIRQVLKLHPGARGLVVVSGESDFDRGWRASFDAVAAGFDSKLARRDAPNRAIRELVAEVATASDDAVVFYLSFSRDGNGTAYTPRDVLELVRRVSPVPIYGSTTTYLGHGVVGGSLADIDAHAAALGRMAVRVLAGERPENITPVTSARKLAFDWRELDRFGISERQLPAGGAIVFRGSGFWTFHPAWIFAAVAVFGGQTALLVAMLAQRRKRASLEHRLKARLRFETLLSDESAALGGVAIARMELAVRAAVQTIRQYLKVDRVSVYELAPDGRTHLTFEDAAPESPALPAGFQVTGLPTVALTLASLQPYVLDDLGDLPVDAASEGAAFTEYGIRSVCVVPLEVGGQTLGALSCVSHTDAMKWSADRVQQVRTLCQPLAHVLQRRLTDSAMAESHRLRGAILSSMPAQITVLDRAGVIIAVNEEWMAFGRANGVRNETSISPGASYVAVCERAVADGVPGVGDVLEGIKAVCGGCCDSYDAEYSLASRDGEQWFAMKVVPLRHGEGGAVVTHRDITAAKQQELALRQSEQRFRLLADAQRVLSGRLITAQEDERRRIARELHDDLQQRLALLAIELDAMSARRPSGEEAAARARELWQRTVEITSEVHALSHRLHPSKLEALGLLKTVQGYCRELSQHGLNVVFQHESVPDDVAPDVALCVFRVVQESLQNVVKHSGAPEARVTMTARDGVLLLRVQDSGRGFDAEALNRPGLGLVSMRERLHLLGGQLTIDSAPGHGTTVAFEVPCPAEDSAPRDGAASQEARI